MAVSAQELIHQLQLLGGGRAHGSPLPVFFVAATPPSQHSQLDPVYSYKVRIINLSKRSEVIIRQINFTSKFDSITSIRVKFVEQFKEQVPNTMDFKIGYYGSQQTKVSLVTADDLSAMYIQHPTDKPINLWS